MPIVELITGLIALVIVLTVPGYFLTLAFFPSKEQIDGIERFTFSLLFSIVFMPLVVLIVNQLLGVPINFVSSFGTLIFLIFLGVIVYYFRLQKIDKREAFNLLFWRN
ncbi:MAG: DUF1616 domain-containing protein [archaeon]|nr:DUF1616 domain-containing protein [archaeon]